MRNGITIYVGSDDENGMTSLAGVDLYDNLPDGSAILKFKGHPTNFILNWDSRSLAFYRMQMAWASRIYFGQTGGQL